MNSDVWRRLLLLTVIIPLVLICASQSASASATQSKVDTGNSELDAKINSFYKCISDTKKDPPTLFVTDQCFFSNVVHGFTTTTTTTLGSLPGLSFHFHHFHSQPHSQIIKGFN